MLILTSHEKDSFSGSGLLFNAFLVFKFACHIENEQLTHFLFAYMYYVCECVSLFLRALINFFVVSGNFSFFFYLLLDDPWQHIVLRVVDSS